MNEPFSPGPGSLAEQICAWFKANPGEELSVPCAKGRDRV